MLINSKNLLPIYLVSGDVPLLVQETCDDIRKKAQEQGFNERKILHIDGKFDWNELSHQSDNLSLFGDKTLWELRNPSAKFDEVAINIIENFSKNGPHNKIWLIITDKLSPAQQKTRWYKAVTHVGNHIPLWPVSRHQLPAWIRERLQRKGLSATTEAIQLLAELTEGNLLATQQAIEKCVLLNFSTHITPEQIRQVMTNNAQFNVFDLADSLLAGQKLRALKILEGLKFSNTEPTLILWALTKEVRHLHELKQQLNQGANAAKLLEHEWQSRRPLIQQALQRTTLTTLHTLLEKAYEADHQIKGIKSGNYWHQFEEMILGS